MDEQSTEQPLEDSTQDQVQPEDTQAQDEQTTETPEQDSGLIEIDGEMYTPEQIKAGFLRMKDYTQKTQELAEMRRASQPVEEPDEEKQVINKFIQENELMTKAEVVAMLQQQEKKSQDQIHFDSYVQKYSPTKEQQNVVKKLGHSEGFAHLPWEKIHEYAYGDKANTVKKVVGRRVVGESTKSSGKRDSGRITAQDIANMSMAEYKKKTPQEWMRIVQGG